MKRVVISCLFFFCLNLRAQQFISLYPTAIPNSRAFTKEEIRMEEDGQFLGYKNISTPTLGIFLPEEKRATGAAVIICPGGGYSWESTQLEGVSIAKAFMRKGVTAFVLKYRLPNDSIMVDKTIGPLQDAQQAIKVVRQRAVEWGVDPRKIGIMGFSAGGHLAATAGTHFNKAYIPNDRNISLRPDFMILVYPVISMTDQLTHFESRENLLGNSYRAEDILQFSNELHVTSDTPPTWLTHAGDDNMVTVGNSVIFYQELIRNKIPTEMHLYPKGNHGFVLSIPTDKWMQPLFEWMEKNDLMD